MKPWVERRLFTEKSEQVVTIQPTEEMDGVILKTNDVGDNANEYRLYLSYEEAKELSNQINSFISENV